MQREFQAGAARTGICQWRRPRHRVAAALALAAAIACGDRGESPDSPLVSAAREQEQELEQELELEQEREEQNLTSARLAFEHWAPLVTAGRFEEARVLCTPWLEKQDHGTLTEAHKCLANVVIADDSLPVPPDAARDGRPDGPRVGSEGVYLAVAHYDQAIELTPDDRDAYVGRADVLILGGRFDDAIGFVDESLERFSTRSDLDAFLLLTARFRLMNRNEEAFEFLKVLERHHPLDHRVVANLGAFHAILGRNEEALEYAKRAVALAPDDPLNRWNLAQLYERGNELEAADNSYRRALDLLQDTDLDARCRYAEFIADRLEDESRACDYSLLECPRFFDERCEGGAARRGAEQAQSS